jgi:hypothetical protein
MTAEIVDLGERRRLTTLLAQLRYWGLHMDIARASVMAKKISATSFFDQRADACVALAAIVLELHELTTEAA